jgi:hypothetical protein
MDNDVLNLSTIDLTEDQLSVLAKWLNFCPTPPPPNPGEQKIDLDALHRRLRLNARFSTSDEDIVYLEENDYHHSTEAFKHRKFRQPSTFNPVGPFPLEAFILSNELDFNRRPQFNKFGPKNMTKGEFQAITQLKALSDKIVIKKADKSSTVVVQDRDKYIAEAQRQLSNPLFYLKVEEDLTEKHRIEVLEYIDEMYNDGEIDISVLNYLHEPHGRTPKFYMLPKTHKGINPPPGRPIVSANGGPTEKI